MEKNLLEEYAQRIRKNLRDNWDSIIIINGDLKMGMSVMSIKQDSNEGKQ